MSRGFKIALVALVVIFEFLFFPMLFNPYPHGMFTDASYRRAERFQALRDYTEHQSADTRAALDHELDLMHRHEDWKGYLALGLLIAANMVAIYCVFRYAPKLNENEFSE